MKSENTISGNLIQRVVNNDLFLFSIRKIINDILLKEMKSSEEINAIALVSSFEEDGLSEIADYLSYEFSDNGEKTLLLSLGKDSFGCDFFDLAHCRNQKFRTRPKALKPVEGNTPAPEPGNSNCYPGGEEYLEPPYNSKAGELPVDGVMKTVYPNLDFLSLKNLRKTRGFIADKDSVKALLDMLKGKYKRIIIDTPPLEENLLGFISAIAADGAYFVCNSRSKRGSVMHKYYTDLKDIGANILGVIFNNAGKKIVRRIFRNDGRKHG
ncbi:MAG: hypothetical protein ACOYIF_07325 [Acetivibrionales bacterium]|jgi:hypothetical protein